MYLAKKLLVLVSLFYAASLFSAALELKQSRAVQRAPVQQKEEKQAQVIQGLEVEDVASEAPLKYRLTIG